MSIATMRIQDVLSRDLSQHIEEIIKLTQADEQTVYTELTEYVATKSIREHYRTLLKAMADAPSAPDEGVGVWVSGFFGSGKSSFAKNLGYVLANRTVLGHPAANLFKRQLDDPAISQWVDYITSRIPTEVIMFDVSVERAVRKTTERIAEILYTQLLRSLGYAEDFDIAELEIELEREGKLDEFVARVQSRGGPPWEVVRTGAQKMNRASAALHEMDSRTYPAADSWARSLAGHDGDITVAKLVERSFELMARRRPGKALTFIVDEVGQYVAQSAEKLNDLRAVVEQFGKESKNRVRARQAIAPVWVVVTSQEKLDQVVSALDSRRVQLAMLQDRFRYHVDLAPADITEVATKRVLDKKPEAEPELRALFTQAQGQINTACHLETNRRASEVSEHDFLRFYPYLPHYIELSIDIMSGIRLQPGAPRHLGGSNRTIIKQTHEMLVSPRTHLADQRVGRLVTLDLIYELVEGNLSSEKQKDISDITQRFKGDAQDAGWAVRVAKALSLLEFVRDLPRTEANLAAVLVDEVGKPAPLLEVKAAIHRLEQAQFVRHTDEGWKLLTAQEKSWETERKAIGVNNRERNDILREMLSSVFDEPRLRTYRYRDLHSFRVGLTVDNVRQSQGDIPLSVLIADEPGEVNRRVEEARSDSRLKDHANDLYWIFALDPELDDLILQLHASTQMLTKYNQVGAQGERAAEVGPLLESEKRDQARYRNRLKDKLEAALARGQGIFRGVSKDASDLGRSPTEVFHHFFESAIPYLYKNLEMGARHLTGNEAEDVLKAANLNALPQVFYGGEQGLNLITKDGAKYVPNVHAEIAKEVLDYLKKEHSFGNRVTGKELDAHFTGIGYGWDLDVIKLVLATLLRAGAIEVTHQGRRYRNALDPQCRTPLTSNPAFRSASFTPRESIDLRTLTTAVRSYEALTGDEVDVEEGAIAEALKRLATEEIDLLLPTRSDLRANNLPGFDVLEDYYSMLTTIRNAASDDCVRMLAGEGNSLKELRGKARRIREALTPQTLMTIAQARRALNEQWPVLQSRGIDGELSAKVDQLRQTLEGDSLYDHVTTLRSLSAAVSTEYQSLYEATHHRRYTAYERTIDRVRGQDGWEIFAQSGGAAELLSGLVQRQCQEPEASDGTQRSHRVAFSEDGLLCTHCRASISQMESDIIAADGLETQAISRFLELTMPASRDTPRTIRRVRAAQYFGMTLDSEQSVEEALKRLREELLKLLAQGASIIVE